jgi:hypothetical protein
MIGSLICHFALDGLENYLLKNLSHRYLRNDEAINCIRGQFGQNKVEQYAKSLDWFSIKVRVYRYVDDILIIGKTSQEQFLDMYERLVLFLKDRGLNLKNKKNLVEVFLPRAKFEFLGFQFQYPGYKNSEIYRWKYTCYSFSEPYTALQGVCSVQRRNNLIITIRSMFYKSIISRFKLLFSRYCVELPVKVLIRNYNKLLTEVVPYFGLTKSIKIQLMKINHLAFLKFKKLLFRKFSSRPKLKTFVRTKYLTSDFLIKDGDSTQLKVQDLFINYRRLLYDIAFSIKFFRANIYLNHFL